MLQLVVNCPFIEEQGTEKCFDSVLDGTCPISAGIVRPTDRCKTVRSRIFKMKEAVVKKTNKPDFSKLKEIAQKFSQKIPIGFGAVVGSIGGDFLIIGDIERIDEKKSDEFLLDSLCSTVKNLFGLVFVIYHLDKEGIVVERYKDYDIFAGLNAEKKIDGLRIDSLREKENVY